MSAQIDYSLDWQWWDNTESLTVELFRSAGASSEVSVSAAFRGDIERKAVEFFGLEVVQNSQVWSVPASLLGSDELLQGDTLTDGDGVVWTVEAATLNTIGTSKLFWSAVTNKQRA